MKLNKIEQFGDILIFSGLLFELFAINVGKRWISNRNKNPNYHRLLERFILSYCVEGRPFLSNYIVVLCNYSNRLQKGRENHPLNVSNIQQNMDKCPDQLHIAFLYINK